MTVYAETSAVLRWLFQEDGFEPILEALRGADKVVCSRLTLIEVRRVSHRAVVIGALPEVQGARMRAVFARAAARWAVLEISADVAARAEQTFPVEPVRTLDAIHLASALALSHALPNLAVLSTDARIRDNAAQLGLRIVP